MMIPYYAREPSEVLANFGVNQSLGLSFEEAKKRLVRFGPNQLPRASKQNLFNLLMAQFVHPMILLLLGVMGISIVIGHFIDGAIIGVIVLLNAIIGFAQEARAEKAMEKIKALAAPEAKVLREGDVLKIASRELVPGDLVMCEAGDLIPADIRLIETFKLQVNESLLTGESISVFKEPHRLHSEPSSLGDQANIGFMGTHVGGGHALGVVVETGSRTELGKIASLLGSKHRDDLPLKKRLEQLTRHLVLAAFFLCLLIFIIGLLHGESVIQMLLASMSLGIAAIPEGLPAVITVSLSLGSLRLAKQGVLVRKLQAVEALGSITVICADKTGTLTENRMTVFYPDFKKEKLLPDFLQALVLCNDAKISRHHQKEVGDSMELALLHFAVKTGMEIKKIQNDFPRVGEIPFDTDRKRMTTIHTHGAHKIAYMKGAPETVLDVCSLAYEENKNLKNLQEKLSEEGLRVIAVAMKKNILDETEKNFTFLGFVGLKDPARQEAKKAIADCRLAGIRPIMMTGDYSTTAMAIGKELGIGRNSIFARVSPEDKLRIIQILKEQNEIVAMTGDGVNDAPALKRADIGIAMGRGTDVAKEASSLILVKENFSTILHAIREGRLIYDNIRKFVRYMLTTNLGEIATMLIVSLAGLPIPLLPVQILWINLVTDGLPAVALGFEPAEGSVMKRKPRSTDENILGRGLWQHTLWVGLLMGLLTTGAFFCALKTGNSLEYAQTISFTTLTFLQMGHVLAIRSELNPLWKIGFFSNWRLVVAVFITLISQVALVSFPFFQEIFHTHPLTFTEFSFCFIPALFVYAAVEVEKALRK